MLWCNAKTIRLTALGLSLVILSCTGIKPKAGTLPVTIDPDVSLDTLVPVEADATEIDESSSAPDDGLVTPDVPDDVTAEDSSDVVEVDVYDVILTDAADGLPLDQAPDAPDQSDVLAQDISSDAEDAQEIDAIDAVDEGADVADLDASDAESCPITSPQCEGAPAPYWALFDHQVDPPVERNIQEFLGKVTVVVFLEST